MKKNTCESCGMPMEDITDFGGNNPENNYCKHCTNEDGTLQDFETRLAGMIKFISFSMNLDETAAEKIAKENMATMPTWKKYFES